MMFRSQQYIGNLLENVAEGQLSTDEFRILFAKVRDKLSVAEDFGAELKTLYRVSNFSDFALSLLWIAERVENDPSKLEYTTAEQALVVEKFRQAVGDISAPPVTEVPVFEAPEQTFTPVAEPTFTPAPESTENPFGEPAAEEPPAAPVEEPPEMPATLQMETAAPIDSSEQGIYAPPPEETPEMPGTLQMETAAPIDSSEQGVYAAPLSAAAGTEGEFATLVEKFVEAMQSGTDERTGLFDSLLSQAGAIMAPGSGYTDDIREFCQYLTEFLNYVRENGFMDDVRVMNILSNISSPVAAWAGADPGSREGLLAEGTEILRTFKSLFE